MLRIISSLLMVVFAGLIAARGQDADHGGAFSQTDIENGTRVYNAQCINCHGPNGDNVSGIDLRRGQFRTVKTPDDLSKTISSGVPGAGMPAFDLTPGELSGIAAFIRSHFDNASTVTVGDSSRGRSIFEGKGNCRSCHRVNGTGSRIAPDLSDIGVARSPSTLLQSLKDPTSMMLPINRPIRFQTADGRTISGRRLNEDTLTIQIIDDKERLHSFTKSDLKNLVVDSKSSMPSYADRLSGEELADIVAYLLSLKGQ